MPRITISITAPEDPADSSIVSLDLPPGLTILDLKNFVQSETKFPVESQQFYLNGSILNGDSKTLEEAGLNDGEMLALLIKRPQRAAHAQPRSGTAQTQPGGMPRNAADEIETIRLRILGDQNALTQIQQGNPQLAAAINDPNRWREEWTNARRDEQRQQREHQRQLELLNADPFDVEAQAKIEEIIRQERVIENLQHAYEHIPEGKLDIPFGSVFVLVFPHHHLHIDFPFRPCLGYIGCESVFVSQKRRGHRSGLLDQSASSLELCASLHTASPAWMVQGVQAKRPTSRTPSRNA
ncbi:hypothetical protein IWX90DRAFT_308493 [Phyllosticta citrichinensis]|uniref:Ubiquitin-like domain-containing protein n=1 Tax=Phyllosticta citrichinensis TaxID=1130410 RepID=A0ABR1XLP9_9PEZI